MIYINRKSEPSFWSDYCKKNPHIQYDSLQETEEGREIRRKLRQHNIEEQHGLCAYCCRKIDLDDSLNEHIKPKGVSSFSNMSLNYDNIIASCNNNSVEQTCSAHKENDYDEELFISPLDPNCETFFEYYTNGEVVSDSPEGKYTIDLLNLNTYKLRRARAAQLRICDSYHDPELVKNLFLEPDADNRYQPFIDIVKYYYGGVQADSK